LEREQRERELREVREKEAREREREREYGRDLLREVRDIYSGDTGREDELKKREAPRKERGEPIKVHEDTGITVIKEPLDIPHPGYDVGEEQPPYANGHQDMQSFTKLFIHNLDFTITKEGILRSFSTFGRLKNINFPYDNRNRPRGLAFVIFERHVDAAKALKAGLRGIILGTRKLRVEIYKPLERLNQEKKEKAKRAAQGSDNESNHGE